MDILALAGPTGLGGVLLGGVLLVLLIQLLGSGSAQVGVKEGVEDE